MKRFIISFLSACLMITTLCACGGSTDYTLFAYDYDGCILASEEMTSTLTLNDDGSGNLTINDSRGRITWSEENGSLTLLAGSDTISGTIGDGIVALDFGDGTLMYYAAEGADTSSIPVMSFEDYLLRSVHGDAAE